MGITKSVFIALIFGLLIIFPFYSAAQTVGGQVVADSTGNPLAYVNIGIVGTAVGAVSDENGMFEISIANQSPEDSVGFTIVGYKPQIFTLTELSGHHNLVRMRQDTVELDELTVTAYRLEKKELGTKKETSLLVTGWGKNVIGGERGLRIKVKEDAIYVQSLHFHLANNGYEQILMRVHIRDFENDMPGLSLLEEDILFTVQQRSGWVTVDLTKYNLKFEDDIVVTLQPVQKMGKCAPNEKFCLVISLGWFKIFSTNWFFAKTASESEWDVHKNRSPGIYLTVYQ